MHAALLIHSILSSYCTAVSNNTTNRTLHGSSGGFLQFANALGSPGANLILQFAQLKALGSPGAIRRRSQEPKKDRRTQCRTSTLLRSDQCGDPVYCGYQCCGEENPRWMHELRPLKPSIFDARRSGRDGNVALTVTELSQDSTPKTMQPRSTL